MKITKSQLKQIIKEELEAAISEKHPLNESLRAFPALLEILMSITATDPANPDQGPRLYAAEALKKALMAMADAVEMTIDIYKDAGKDPGTTRAGYAKVLENAVTQLDANIQKLRAGPKRGARE